MPSQGDLEPLPSPGVQVPRGPQPTPRAPSSPGEELCLPSLVNLSLLNWR